MLDVLRMTFLLCNFHIILLKHNYVHINNINNERVSIYTIYIKSSWESKCLFLIAIVGHMSIFMSLQISLIFESLPPDHSNVTANSTGLLSKNSRLAEIFLVNAMQVQSGLVMFSLFQYHRYLKS